MRKDVPFRDTVRDWDIGCFPSGGCSKIQDCRDYLGEMEISRKSSCCNQAIAYVIPAGGAHRRLRTRWRFLTHYSSRSGLP